MAVPVRLSAYSPWRKIVAAGIITAVATLVVGIAESNNLTGRMGESFYSWFYASRSIEDRTASSTVIVGVDQGSLDFFDTQFKFGWPWPRDLWGHAIHYLEQSGAKCIIVDLLFTETSQYAGDLDDDHQFAEAIDNAKIPIVLATILDHGKLSRFAPPVKKPPAFGVTNNTTDPLAITFRPVIADRPSLALAAVQSASAALPDWGTQEFWLHYYGPHRDARSGKFTFRQIPAANVIAADIDPAHDHGIKTEEFRGKIVLIGAITAGTYDLKVTPRNLMPGVEVNATAIENLLFHQRVLRVGSIWTAVTAAIACLAGALGSMFPRQTWIKLLLGMTVLGLLIFFSRHLFLMSQVRWLNPSSPLLAAIASIVLSLGWSYFIEDRQGRFLVKALSQCVSPHVTHELRHDPSKLNISTEKRELTILFSDIVDFTTLSERLGEKIGPLLNYYLDQMSASVMATDGFLDKYIGDAILSFWNAPLLQTDHAILACRTALAMKARLAEIQPELSELGAPGLACRVGINTGIVTYGMMGSSYKVNYSVIGDAVNFASRLEGANKFYNSGIMLGESTADLVRNQFLIRKLDLLQVKGKMRPAAVYQLLCERNVAAHQPERATCITPHSLATLTDLVHRYESALEKYFVMEWDTAEQKFLDLQRDFPDDGPTQTMLKRVLVFRDDPPPPGWDGVYIAKTK